MSETNGVPKSAPRLTREQLAEWLDRKPPPGNWRTKLEHEESDEQEPEDEPEEEP